MKLHISLRNAMLEVDDSQEFVWELLDEVVNKAESIIFKKYLDKQTIPYTISEAKKAILHIIDVTKRAHFKKYQCIHSK